MPSLSLTRLSCNVGTIIPTSNGAEDGLNGTAPKGLPGLGLTHRAFDECHFPCVTTRTLLMAPLLLSLSVLGTLQTVPIATLTSASRDCILTLHEGYLYVPTCCGRGAQKFGPMLFWMFLEGCVRMRFTFRIGAKQVAWPRPAQGQRSDPPTRRESVLQQEALRSDQHHRPSPESPAAGSLGLGPGPPPPAPTQLGRKASFRSETLQAGGRASVYPHTSQILNEQVSVLLWRTDYYTCLPERQ